MGNREICVECKLYGKHSEQLKPTGPGGGRPATWIACRHFTCSTGVEAAIVALREHARRNDGRMVSKVAFGSSHKPMGTRMVDTDGQILSEQNGEFYPTGQFLHLAVIFAEWEEAGK